jgi:uncharacterized membrane protein
MCGNQAFHVTPAIAARQHWPAGKHHFEDVQQLFRDLEIALITGVVERDQDFV